MKDLIDDALVIIFSFLDESSLINARKVCQRWKNVIDDNPQLTKNFCLEIGSSKTEAFKTYEIYKKLNYQNIHVSCTWITEYNDDRSEEINLEPIVREILDYHKNNIKIAHFDGVFNYFLAENLPKLKFLEKLTFGYNIRLYEPYHPKEVLLPNLKELDGLRHKVRIIAPKLEKLSGSGIKAENLKGFPNLKHLQLTSINDSQQLEAISQELTSLEIPSDFSLTGNRQNIGILNLLESQKDSLKNLSLSTANREQELEFAIFKMNLEKLHFYVPYEFKIMGDPSETIKELSLVMRCFNWEGKPVYTQDAYGPYGYEGTLYCPNQFFPAERLVNIFYSCPNVEKLIFEYSDCFFVVTLKIACRIFKNLKHLAVRDGISYFNEEMDLSFIETLKINGNNDSYQKTSAHNLKALILSCKNVRSITTDKEGIVNYNFSAEDMIEIFEKLENLEEISSKCGFKLYPEVVDFLTTKKLKLRKLELKVLYEDELEDQKVFARKLNANSSILKCIVEDEASTIKMEEPSYESNRYQEMMNDLYGSDFNDSDNSINLDDEVD